MSSLSPAPRVSVAAPRSEVRGRAMGRARRRSRVRVGATRTCGGSPFVSEKSFAVRRGQSVTVTL
eukprot:1735892-Prymnesium_polylepis.2